MEGAKPNGCCKMHSGVDNRVGQLEDRANKHDTKIDVIEKRTVVILTTVIITLLGIIGNLIVSLANHFMKS